MSWVALLRASLERAKVTYALRQQYECDASLRARILTWQIELRDRGERYDA